jgi:hypothetical protein
MKCPHCTISIHANWDDNPFVWRGQVYDWYYRWTNCPECKRWTIEIQQGSLGWRQVYPSGANRGPAPASVPKDIAADYAEACAVLSTSAKASAALARRCLQSILRAHGYKDRDLANEIDLLLNESDARKGIPQSLRDTIDGIRNFGNFSTHPITDITSLQIIDVEPHEAEWCLEIVEEMFEHFYVKPAIAKSRKAALDAKLKSAGKPPSK